MNGIDPEILPELLMAYADGELGPIEAKRVERAIAADPALAAEVARHRALRDRLAHGFAPLAAEPVPDRLAQLIHPSNVVAFAVPAKPRSAPRWQAAAALAACLVVGVVVGRGLPDGGPIRAEGGALYAAGDLASALRDQVGGEGGPQGVRVALSFRDTAGGYCRVFRSAAADGIACRDATGWALRRTEPGSLRAGPAYAQAGTPGADLMATAQEMAADAPLDAAGERRARASGWR